MPIDFNIQMNKAGKSKLEFKFVDKEEEAPIQQLFGAANQYSAMYDTEEEAMDDWDTTDEYEDEDGFVGHIGNVEDTIEVKEKFKWHWFIPIYGLFYGHEIIDYLHKYKYGFWAFLGWGLYQAAWIMFDLYSIIKFFVT